MSLKPQKARQSKSKDEQSHVDHVFRFKEDHLQQILETGPYDQSVSLQGDPPTYASLGAQEETRVVAGQIVVASPRQCTGFYLPG